MAMLEIKVTFVGDGTGQLVDNAVNRATIFMFGGAKSGNIPRGKYRNNCGGPLGAYDLNNVATPGSINVASFAPVRFDSGDLLGNPSLASDLGDFIEKFKVRIVDVTAPNTALTRADLMAFVNAVST